MNTMFHCRLFLLQLQSFETELSVPKLSEKEGGNDTCRGVFIRAPAILEVGPDVEILADCPVPADRPSITISFGEGTEVCILLFFFTIYIILQLSADGQTEFCYISSKLDF
jgi:5'-phosphate synthase pdxT subunit